MNQSKRLPDVLQQVRPRAYLHGKCGKLDSTSSKTKSEKISSSYFHYSRMPIVKAGGMRIVQHKSPASTQGKDPVEVIGKFQLFKVKVLCSHFSVSLGLAQNNPLDTAVQLSTSPSQKTMTLESAHFSHAEKPPQSHPYKPVNHIQQPRK